MDAPISMKPPFTAVAASSQAPRVLRAPGAQRLVQAVAAVGAAALAGIVALAQWDAPPSALTQELQSFEQRVSGGAATPMGASAREVLARRYLGTLAPELRQRISDQVRAEQRAGLTLPGNDAFVMRRLALYEAALQQAGGAPAPR